MRDVVAATRLCVLLPATLAAALTACSSSGAGLDDDDDSTAGRDAGAGADAAPEVPTFQRCVGRPFTAGETEAWQQLGTPIVVATGGPGHSAEDRVVATAAALELRGKFTYGLISKDLEGELVRVYLDDCSGWVDLGAHETDADGRVAVAGPTDLPPGEYGVRFEVAGDLSATASTAWVLPPGTHLAVTDIDGTLTTSDTELFREILDGSHVPEAYPGAVELTEAHAALGHVIVYLTGRPYLLTDVTRAWLADLGFAAGALHLTDEALDVLPTEAQVGAYKLAFLQSLIDAGFVLDLAYGNATTDIYAYLGVAIPPELVWIIGDNAGVDGTNAVTETWMPRVAEVEVSPAIEQPFDW
jgi:phosphatidate phosphatase APP1